MKKIIALTVIAVALTGCGRIENWFSHTKSKWIGIDRTVTLYAANGNVIKTWKVDNTIEYVGGGMRFVDETGKTISISGTVVAEEN